MVNSVPLKASTKTNTRITQLSIAPLLGEAIRRIHYKKSISALFRQKKKLVEQAKVIKPGIPRRISLKITGNDKSS